MLYCIYQGSEMIDVLDLDEIEKDQYQEAHPNHQLIADRDIPMGGDLYDEWK